jgi:hypothetical protein
VSCEKEKEPARSAVKKNIFLNIVNSLSFKNNEISRLNAQQTNEYFFLPNPLISDDSRINRQLPPSCFSV